MYLVPAVITIIAPLLGSGLIGIFGGTRSERIAKIGIWAMVISAGAAVATLYGVVQGGSMLLRLSDWPQPFTPTLLVDRLTGIMMVLITVVSLVIHLFSRRYMQGDALYVRYFGLVGLLTFVLLSLVSSGNLLWLFLWWHAVTWLLKTLLSLNHASVAARQAGQTTLRTQTLGDLALLLAIVVLYRAFGTVDVPELFERLQASDGAALLWQGTSWDIDVVTFVTLLLVLTIMTKSAQFPVHIWLPGTIEAPTPVSAMLHAGIVNAGGFLVNRLAPLYGMAPTTLHVLFVIGALTALIGAATMLTQPSIKRTLVYSTMGQMGYMVMECGLGAFALAIFHLCAHGLFKATLFLNSGANIQKARTEYKHPSAHAVTATGGFSLITWATGLVITLLLPLIILLIAHGLVNIPLFEAQGAVIFLFFAWVTSSQAVFSLYRLDAVASWKVSATMLATLAFIGLTYLWAGEAFTHFLYSPEEAARSFDAAAWPQGLFDTFVVLSALSVVAVWILLYGQAHGMQLLLPQWLEEFRTRLYVAFLNALYVEDFLRGLGRGGVPRDRTLRRVAR